MKNRKIAMIGAGNVATHLAQALLKAGFNLCQIYSRTIESARKLGMKTGITYTSELHAVYPDCDMYIFCLSDDAILPVYKSLRINHNAIVMHTSGSIPMDIFKNTAINYGVLYPLQTFSQTRDISFDEIPLFIEASNASLLKELRRIAMELSVCVEEADSEKRLHLHLSAVIASNFTNHLYNLAGELLKEYGLNFSVLHPLIAETAHKVMSFSPEEAQTGPAVRGDESVIQKHKMLLKDEKTLYSIYTLLTNSIKSRRMKNEEKMEEDDRQMSLW